MPTKIFEPSGQTGADVQSAINAASAVGGGVVLLDGVSYTDVNATIPSDNIHIIGTGKTRLLAPASGAINVLSAQGTLGTATTLTANAAQFTDQVVVASAAGLAVGGFIQFSLTVPNAYDTNTFQHRAEIITLAGTTMTFTPPLPFAIVTTQTHSVRPLTMLRDIKIDGVTFDANGNVAVSRGLYLAQTMRTTVRGCEFQGFVAAAGMMLANGVWNRAEDIYAKNCGSPGENDVSIYGQTLGEFDNITSRSASGFGPGLYWSTYSNGRGWSSVKAANRGIKFNALVMCSMSDIDGHQSGSTGLAITNGCQRLQISRARACRNRSGAPGNRVGLWFSDRSDQFVTIDQLIARDNADRDIRMFATNTNITIRMADYGTLDNYGTGNTISAT